MQLGMDLGMQPVPGDRSTVQGPGAGEGEVAPSRRLLRTLGKTASEVTKGSSVSTNGFVPQTQSSDCSCSSSWQLLLLQFCQIH